VLRKVNRHTSEKRKREEKLNKEQKRDKAEKGYRRSEENQSRQSENFQREEEERVRQENRRRAEEERRRAEEQKRSQSQHKFEESTTKDERYYGAVLGLSGPVVFEEVKRQYRELAAQYHPDKVNHLGPKLKEVAEQEMKKINEAYEFFKQKNGLK
jgi:hypothetical protein